MTDKIRTLQGRVVSDKMDKSITVAIERKVKHPIYGKTYKIINELQQENTKLKAEIERLNKQSAESKAEGVGILYNILELREENKWLEEQVEKLEKYNSELCMELTITMDKLCLAEKESIS